MYPKKAKAKDYKDNKPLEVLDKGGPYNRHDLKYYGFQAPKEIDLCDIYFKQIKQVDVPIVFGIGAQPEDFLKYDFLHCYDDISLVVKKPVLDIFSQECPDDFFAHPVVIKNYNPKDKSFENHDYYLIVTKYNEIEALDYEKSIFEEGSDYPEQPVYIENGMGNHKLGNLKESPGTFLIAPDLAYKMRHFKGVEFKRGFTPEEIEEIKAWIDSRMAEAERRRTKKEGG